MTMTRAPVRLECRQRADRDGAVHMTLLGEVDVAVADELVRVLRDISDAGTAVRLDLSELGFIDMAGLSAILAAMSEARRAGSRLEIDPDVSPAAARIIGLAGVSRRLWPRRRPGRPTGSRRRRGDQSRPGA
jgi:anti-anti-sigma factor